MCKKKRRKKNKGREEARHAGMQASRKERMRRQKTIKGKKARVRVGGGEHIRLGLQIQPPIS